MMIRNIGIGVAALALIVGGCNRSQSGNSSTDNRQVSGDRDKITVTGCLQQAEQGLGSNSSDSDRFVLTDAKATAAGAGGAAIYRLDGNKDDLRPHMNQRVEVIGTVDNDAAPASPGSAAEPSPELNVETVRMVAANCQ